MYCPNCGSDNQFEVRFCRRCGTSLEAVAHALSNKAQDRPQEKSQLSKLIKDYYSGRQEMLAGLGGLAVSIAVPAGLLYAGRWGFFWIFVWFCVGIFGNGMNQFNKGWKKWSDAGTDLKIMGYELPPNKTLPLRKSDTGKIRESGSEEPSQLSGTSEPPSVTEATTRQLDLEERS